MLGELFDPQADFGISEHFRPHWSQAGAIVFITFRTHDSIPQQVLQRWEREKQDWMERRGHAGRWSDIRSEHPHAQNSGRINLSCANKPPTV